MHHEGALNIQNPNYVVSDFFKDGWWDIPKLKVVVSEELVQRIISFPIGIFNAKDDCRIWKTTSNDSCTDIINKPLHMN